MAFALRLLPFVFRLALAAVGLGDKSKLKEKIMVRFLRPLPGREFSRLCYSFVPEIDKMLLPRVMELLRQADEAIIVSASLRLMIEPWAVRYGVKAVIATELAYDRQGRVCGFAGHNCKGREKVRRLRQYIAQYMPESDCELSGYGNLPDDIPLLEFCDKAYIVSRKSGKYEITAY